ncbi:hypothetical protein D3C87_1386640 [compost metagenome]
METLKIPILDSSSIVFAVLPFLAIFVGNFLFKSHLKQADENSKIEEKLPVYQTASIIRWAILEGVAFVILFLKPDLVLFGLIAIGYLIFLRPTEEKINADFQNV